MAQGKFASITSSLLARKGEAAPWQEPGRVPLAWSADSMRPQLPPATPAPPRREQAMRPEPPATGAMKRCSLRLSQLDYERLGHIAVKKNITRQQLLQEMMGQVLENMARNYARDCSCIGGGGCGNTCAGQG